MSGSKRKCKFIDDSDKDSDESSGAESKPTGAKRKRVIITSDTDTGESEELEESESEEAEEEESEESEESEELGESEDTEESEQSEQSDQSGENETLAPPPEMLVTPVSSEVDTMNVDQITQVDDATYFAKGKKKEDKFSEDDSFWSSYVANYADDVKAGKEATEKLLAWYKELQEKTVRNQRILHDHTYRRPFLSYVIIRFHAVQHVLREPFIPTPSHVEIYVARRTAAKQNG